MRDSILDLLRPEISIPVDDGLREIVAKERDKGAKLKKLRVKNIPKNASAFELDHTPTGELGRTHRRAFKQLSCLIRGDHPTANKKCDLVIAYKDGNSLIFIVADMKSERPSRSACKKQLKNSEIFVRYIAQLIVEYYGIHGDVVVKKVVFSSKRATIAKPLTQQKNRAKPKLDDGVYFVELPLGGRNNATAVVSLREFN